MNTTAHKYRTSTPPPSWTRARIFSNRPEGARMSLQIPQISIALAFVKHFGGGEVDTYRHPETGKVFNHIVIEGDALREVLRRLRPHLLSGRRFAADHILGSREHVRRGSSRPPAPWTWSASRTTPP